MSQNQKIILSVMFYIIGIILTVFIPSINVKLIGVLAVVFFYFLIVSNKFYFLLWISIIPVILIGSFMFIKNNLDHLLYPFIFICLSISGIIFAFSLNLIPISKIKIMFSLAMKSLLGRKN